jgi:hypothetical protein
LHHKERNIFLLFSRGMGLPFKKKEVWVNDNIMNGAKGNHI